MNYQKRQLVRGFSMFNRDMKDAKEQANKGLSPFGYYADRYFTTVKETIEALPAGYQTPEGFSPKEDDVRMQVFMRHPGGCLVAGVDLALSVIANGISNQDLKDIQVKAINDGTFVKYSGNADDVTPVLEIFGPYHLFAELETTYLGLLARCTRIANHVLECLDAANGTPVLFFPERFDSYTVQEIDGYAYWMAVKYYNELHGTNLPVIVSSPASAALFGPNGKYQGSTPHALSADFGMNEVEAMVRFGLHQPPEVKRIFLADFSNDVILSTMLVTLAYWKNYIKALRENNQRDLLCWRLWGIRIDTSASLIDKTMAMNGQTEGGVSPMLVEAVRDFMDKQLPAILVEKVGGDPEIAKEYCHSLSITVTGGFGSKKIKRFEDGAGISQWRIPVNAYGVGSGMLINDGTYDFTADISDMHRNGRWYKVSKVGRAPNYNKDMLPVNLDDYLA